MLHRGVFDIAYMKPRYFKEQDLTVFWLKNNRLNRNTVHEITRKSLTLENQP